jgi:beta-phosphoglucomutase
MARVVLRQSSILGGMIFDLDGVIADTHPIHRRSWRQLLAERGQEVSEEELDFVLEGRKREEILRHFLGNLSAAEILDYGRRKDELFRQFLRELKCIPGLINLLCELESATIPVAVATSASRGRALLVLEKLGLAHCFRAILTAEDTLHGKPDPSILFLALGAMRVPAQRTLVAEDSEAGVRAAKSAGMKCLAIATPARGFRLSQAGADRAVPNFQETTLADLQSLFETTQSHSSFAEKAPDIGEAGAGR